MNELEAPRIEVTVHFATGRRGRRRVVRGDAPPGRGRVGLGPGKTGLQPFLPAQGPAIPRLGR